MSVHQPLTGVAARIVQVLRGSDTCLLLAHVNPDGDVLGSQLGLGLALLDQGKRVTLASPHPVPEPFRFLSGTSLVEEWKEGEAPPGEWEIAVLADCPDPGRTGGILESCRGRVRTLVNIDHHPDNRRFGDLNWVEISASATGELVYDLIQDLGWPLTPEVATALYTAIVTDTGFFRYSNTTPKALAVASRLVAAGAQPAQVANHLFEQRRLEGLHFLGALLQRIETNPQGTVAWLALTGDLLAADPAMIEAEDLVTYPRSIATAKVGILFWELGPEKTKVSLRAKGEVNVAAVATRFGGGGHPNAAGCTVQAPLAEAQARVLQALSQAMGR